MTTYFWSDTHLNHAGIIGYCPETRGRFADVHEMNAWIIETWNATVAPNDDMWLVGDLGFANKYGLPLDDVFAKLHGRKHLVRGNHDLQNPIVLKLPWETQHDLVTVKQSKTERIVACHYPFETWDRAPKGYLHVHGHSHNTLKRVIPHRYDVGMDALGREGPVSFDFLWALGETEEFEPADHHGD